MILIKKKQQRSCHMKIKLSKKNIKIALFIPLEITIILLLKYLIPSTFILSKLLVFVLALGINNLILMISKKGIRFFLQGRERFSYLKNKNNYSTSTYILAIYILLFNQEDLFLSVFLGVVCLVFALAYHFDRYNKEEEPK